MNERIELNAHSTYDTMDSVLTIEDITLFAYDNEMPALALTDLNCVQGFPAFERQCKRVGIKPIYGAKIIHGSFKENYPCVSTVLVKNQTGLKNLYRIISELKNDGACVNVPMSILEKYHDGLLYGSAGHEGNLFLSHIYGNFDEYKNFLNLYDYYEIENFYDTPKERQANKIIATMAKGLKKPVVAVSDARYLEKQDYISLEILGKNSRTNRLCEHCNNLYLRTTEEMLKEFSYLGDDTEDVVINNTQKIAEQIENVTIIPNGYFNSVIDGAYDKIKMFAEGFAANKYGDIFPETIPPEIKQRLDAELNLPIVKDCADKLLFARQFVKEIKSHNGFCGTRGAVASSFLAYCLGITEINPLPPHYYCTNCKKIEWINDVTCGYDLPEKKCSCGTTMQGDGMNIHYEALYGFTGDKVPNITLNFSKEMQNIISNKFENEYKINTAFTSTVSTISETHALHLISEYANKTGKDFTKDEKRKIINELSNVKKADAIHPACLMLFPKDKEILDFTPINEDKYNGLPITHFRHYDLWDAVPYLEIMPTDFCDFLQTLEFETGVNINDVPINAKTLLELAKNDDLEGITEFGTEYVSKMITVANPQTFSDLIKINGLVHGTGTWENNAEDLLKKGVCTLSEIPTSRDDIYNDLVSHGLEKENAFRYSEIVRKGFLVKWRTSNDIGEDFENDLTNIGMPKWYIDYCKKIRYLFPKAHACELSRIAVIEAFYKANYNELYHQLYRRITRA